MTKKLIQVVRGTAEVGMEFYMPTAARRVAAHAQAVLTPLITNQTDHVVVPRQAEFFYVDERDLETYILAFATANPGYEVRTYNLESVSQCPAAPLVTKTVSADGILPA